MRIHLNTQQERPRVKCDCVFVPWHASGPSCVWCPSITGNLALCELIKVESICSDPRQLTPELLLTHPATRAKLPSPLRPMTRDSTGGLVRIGRSLPHRGGRHIERRTRSSVYWRAWFVLTFPDSWKTKFSQLFESDCFCCFFPLRA